jgi:hypothetical protein
MAGISEYKLGPVIATRELTLGVGKKVTIKIGKPQRMPGHPSYFCAYQILGIENDNLRRAAGIDSVQALQLVLQKIGIDLYALNKANGGTLNWEAGEHSDLGFPLSDDLLNILNS